jgi:putative flippase GtrA
MTVVSHYDRVRAKLIAAKRARALGFKAISFGLIGVVNTIVDYSVFLIARAALSHAAMALAAIGALADVCGCGSAGSILLIVANLMSWTVGITGSYILNSSFTFAAESQRQLRWRAYFTYVLAGVAGLIANTTTLVVAAQIFLLPVWAAKGCAIFASFVVNFSISNFIVFRVRRRVAEETENRT